MTLFFWIACLCLLVEDFNPARDHLKSLYWTWIPRRGLGRISGLHPRSLQDQDHTWTPRGSPRERAVVPNDHERRKAITTGGQARQLDPDVASLLLFFFCLCRSVTQMGTSKSKHKTTLWAQRPKDAVIQEHWWPKYTSQSRISCRSSRKTAWYRYHLTSSTLFSISPLHLTAPDKNEIISAGMTARSFWLCY